MKPKQTLLILCLSFVATITIAQNTFDKLKVKDGRTLKGKLVSKDSIQIRFRTDEISGLPQTYRIPLGDIEKLTLNTMEGRDTNFIKSFTGFSEEVKKPMDFKDTGFHLKRGGKFGIAGVSLLVVGSVFGIVGAIKGINGLAYTGAAMSVLGGIFLIVPYGQMIRAGKKYPKQVN